MRAALKLAALSLLVSVGAHAQTMILPPQMQGQAVMNATTTSLPINAANVTLSPGNASFPLKRSSVGILRIKNQGTANVTVCWMGGTCTATAGEILQPGESSTKGVAFVDFSVNPPTVIAASGTQQIELEW